MGLSRVRVSLSVTKSLENLLSLFHNQWGSGMVNIVRKTLQHFCLFSVLCLPFSFAHMKVKYQTFKDFIALHEVQNAK